MVAANAISELYIQLTRLLKVSFSCLIREKNGAKIAFKIKLGEQN
jgi:hypothetical protein